MSIDKEAVKKVSHLARIRLDENKIEGFTEEIGGIMKWIEQLGEVNTDGIEPMTSVVDMEAYQRKDEVNDGGIREKVLANAPENIDGFFAVPKVVE